MPVLAAIGEKHQSNPVVSTAYELASALDEELLLLHVVPDEEFESHREMILDAVGTDDYSFRQEEQSAAQFSETVAKETLGDFDEERVRGVGRIGDPESTIVAAADEYDVSYLVIGRYKRSPTGKAIFGSTTQSVLLNTDRPTVTVAADGDF
ncbi:MULTISPECIES: universal stress protein [Salinibaculum]|uniref:universal stress protein n=1 Tax=Salinibaculum TaxID=2732368 RepID=UPI0030CC8581